MDKEDKVIVLNGINVYSEELEERLLPIIRSACKFGLQKGKPGWTIDRLRDLADELEKYNDESFTLDDMQDYRG